MSAALIIFVLAGGYVWWARRGEVRTPEDIEVRDCATIIGGITMLFAVGLLILGQR